MSRCASWCLIGVRLKEASEYRFADTSCSAASRRESFRVVVVVVVVFVVVVTDCNNVLVDVVFDVVAIVGDVSTGGVVAAIVIVIVGVISSATWDACGVKGKLGVVFSHACKGCAESGVDDTCNASVGAANDTRDASTVGRMYGDLAADGGECSVEVSVVLLVFAGPTVAAGASVTALRDDDDGDDIDENGDDDGGDNEDGCCNAADRAITTRLGISTRGNVARNDNDGTSV